MDQSQTVHGQIHREARWLTVLESRGCLRPARHQAFRRVAAARPHRPQPPHARSVRHAAPGCSAYVPADAPAATQGSPHPATARRSQHRRLKPRITLETRMRRIICREASAQSQPAVAGQQRAGLADDNVLAGQIECRPHMFQRSAAKRRGLGREVEPDRHIDPGDRGAARAAAPAARHPGRAGCAPARCRAAGVGATRSATAPLAGEPPISSARSSTAARPLPTVSRPSARNGTGGAGSSTARSGRGWRSCPASVPSARQLAGEAGAEAVGLALPVERHVQPGRAIGARRGQPRGEMPVLAAELRRAGRRTARRSPAWPASRRCR